MAKPKRLFTLEEARALVGELRTQLQALRRRYEQMRSQEEEVLRAAEKARENGGISGGARYVYLLEDLHRLLHRVTDRGVEVKDLGSGLVDFPAERDGRVVYLCWRCDEETISFWHELDAGFKGRMPLEE